MPMEDNMVQYRVPPTRTEEGEQVPQPPQDNMRRAKKGGPGEDPHMRGGRVTRPTVGKGKGRGKAKGKGKDKAAQRGAIEQPTESKHEGKAPKVQEEAGEN